ncbi:hypothetical protein, partial [Escherichia coli]|uniref:hypothetical protein n=1 Tax=Escherichia coli TaxID=562 RepID=UPI0021503E39
FPSGPGHYDRGLLLSGINRYAGLCITFIARRPFYCQMASELITVWPVITRSRWGYWVISFHENTQLASEGLLRQ